MTWIATKEIVTSKFTLAPGMPLPQKYRRGRDMERRIVERLQQDHGTDAFQYVDYKKPTEIAQGGQAMAALEAELDKLRAVNAEIVGVNRRLQTEVEKRGEAIKLLKAQAARNQQAAS